MAIALEQPELQKILPHAYPFVLIDRVIDCKPGESLVAVKNITANEWPFDGHDSDIYPEVLLIEAAAQAALVLYCLSKTSEPSAQRRLFVLGKIKAEFQGDVTVGNQVRFDVTSGKMMAQGGYSDVEFFSQNASRGKVEIFYSLRAQ